MTRQADALGQGLAVGALGNAYRLRMAPTAAGFALAPAVALYGRATARLTRSEDVAPGRVEPSEWGG